MRLEPGGLTIIRGGLTALTVLALGLASGCGTQPPGGGGGGAAPPGGEVTEPLPGPQTDSLSGADDGIVAGPAGQPGGGAESDIGPTQSGRLDDQVDAGPAGQPGGSSTTDLGPAESARAEDDVGVSPAGQPGGGLPTDTATGPVEVGQPEAGQPEAGQPNGGLGETGG